MRSDSKESELVAHKEIRVFRRRILGWAKKRKRPFPWRLTDDPYAVLIGELLLQRTRGENVVAAYEEFIDRWPTANELALARTQSIARVIRPLGLAKRAPIIKQVGKTLASDFGGNVPRDIVEMKGLPGVGPYTSHAVQVFARNANLPLVDWVIARVLRRYFIRGSDQAKRPNSDHQLWDLAGRLVVAGRARELWLSVLDFATEICKPRPRCSQCPLNDSCGFYAEVRLQEEAAS